MAVETIDDLYRVAGESSVALSAPLGRGARVSADVQAPQGVKTPFSNVNPAVEITGVPHFPDHVRHGLYDSRPAHRGYIAMFENPFQHWQMDRFYSGKLVMGAPPIQMATAGMAPDTPQRSNIPVPSVTSYGDLVTLTTRAAGVDPYTGW